MWIARDRINKRGSNLSVYLFKPTRGKHGNLWRPFIEAPDAIELLETDPIGKNQTWEMEPSEVILVDAGEHVRLMDIVEAINKKCESCHSYDGEKCKTCPLKEHNTL